MSLRHPLLVAAAVAVTLGAMLATIAASSEGALWKMLLVALALGLPGALAATSQPRNPVGWLLMAVASVLSAMALAVQVDGSGNLGAWASWLVERAGAIVVPLMFVVLVLLPDGRLPSPRWRPVVAIVVAVQVAVIAVWSLIDAEAGTTNPLGVLPASWADAANRVADWVLQVPLLLAAGAIVIRLLAQRGPLGAGRSAGRSSRLRRPVRRRSLPGACGGGRAGRAGSGGARRRPDRHPDAPTGSGP